MTELVQNRGSFGKDYKKEASMDTNGSKAKKHVTHFKNSIKC